MNMYSVLLTLVGMLTLGFNDNQARAVTQQVVQPLSSGEAAPARAWAGDDHHQHSTSPGKPAAAIHLHSEAVHSASLYESKKIEVVLKNHALGGTVDIEARADDGLLLLSPQYWSVSAEKSFITLPIELQAVRDGIHHLHLLIQHRDADGASTPRALAVQVAVGEVADVQLFNKQGATYPTVIQLRAEEEIY